MKSSGRNFAFISEWEGSVSSSQVDGEFKSRTRSTATAFSPPQRREPKESGLDMRRCLPGLSAGLAAMFAVIANRLERGFEARSACADIERLQFYKF
jgi:hypothetical protein